MAIKFTKAHSFGNETVYQAFNGKLTIPFTVERIKDGIGTLLRVESAKTGFFEEYGMAKVKQRISLAFAE